ncbi:ADP-ribosylation factor, Arf Arf6 [Asimina triloba]
MCWILFLGQNNLAKANQKGIFLLQAGVCLLVPRDLLLGILFFLSGELHDLVCVKSAISETKHIVCHAFMLIDRNEKNQLLLGIRRANRPQTVMPSSVLSSDSMHIGLLAAAAHAAATNSRFTAVHHTRVSVGMRFRMLFETEESSVRRYMGTITGISDLDPVRWPNSHWHSVKVGWDESTAGERQPRVSLWEIEPLTTFPMYPSLFPLRLKRPWHPGVPSYGKSPYHNYKHANAACSGSSLAPYKRTCSICNIHKPVQLVHDMIKSRWVTAICAYHILIRYLLEARWYLPMVKALVPISR